MKYLLPTMFPNVKGKPAFQNTTWGSKDLKSGGLSIYYVALLCLPTDINTQHHYNIDYKA